jgi:hypothetical protein
MTSTAGKWTAGISAIGALGVTAALVVGRRFGERIDSLDQKLAEAQTHGAARSDLPPEVRALAARLGADAGKIPAFVDLRQSGTMWFKPGGMPLAFTARQRIGTSSTGFVWRAIIGPLGAMTVVDAFVGGRGLLEARLFGTVRLARQDGTDALNQGEALRYLAEIAWNPDIILFDHALEWTVLAPRSVAVATGAGNARAEITFGLDETGLIETARAASRTFATGKDYPWHGRFWDYEAHSGRNIPMQGEVAWVIDGDDFIYWRGRLESWHAHGVEMAAE